jgi:hypothetical protein
MQAPTVIPVLSLTTNGPVAVIRFSQPSNVNVITLRWAEEMQVALENVSRDANVRAVMLCGAGRGFLAGGDLAYLHRTPPEKAAREADTLILQLNKVIESIVALPIPTVVQGENTLRISIAIRPIVKLFVDPSCQSSTVSLFGQRVRSIRYLRSLRSSSGIAM